MQSLKGRKVTVTLDKETLELEARYCGLIDNGEAPPQSRSEIMRGLYRDHLKTVVRKNENCK